jgi:hypothetical protein
MAHRDQDARDALTRQDLTAFRELFRLLRRMRDHGALDSPEVLDLRQKIRGIGFESLGLGSEPRRYYWHIAKSYRG